MLSSPIQKSQDRVDSEPIRSIDWLFNPISKETFLNEYFEKKHLHIKRADANYYRDLLTLEDIDELMASQVLKYPMLRMTKLNEDIDGEKYTMGDRIIPSQVLKLFSEGGTIILASLHDYVKSLNAYVTFLTKEFGHQFQNNIYITPRLNQGFNVHYDTHDVFVLQVKGKKKWRVYDDNPVSLASKLQEFEKGKYEHGPLLEEFVLEEGDLLYIPRGMMHDAETMDEMSVHITTGWLGYTWTDLFVEALLNLSKNNADMRKFVPPNLMSGDQDAENFNKDFAAYFELLQKHLKLDEIVGRLQLDLLTKQKNSLTDLIKTADALEGISTETNFELRPGISVLVKEKGEQLVMEWVGKKVEFPTFTRPAIDYILNEIPHKFKASDLPECMDEAGLLALLKRLVKEGLLAIY